MLRLYSGMFTATAAPGNALPRHQDCPGAGGWSTMGIRPRWAV